MLKKVISTMLIFCLLIPFVNTFAINENKTEDYINFISEFNIINGDPDGNFRLDDLVTRAEFSKIAIAASNFRNSVAQSLSVSPFKDVSYDYWAAPYIKVALSNQLVNGYEDSTFRPQNDVLYEEAVTICLKLLGYTNDDFASSWPYGPVGIAKNIDLVKNMDTDIGNCLTRRDAVTLVYNLLNCKEKSTPVSSNQKYLSIFNCTLIEDVVLIATSKEDTSVGANKVATSNGTYKIGKNLDIANIGNKGNAIIKDGDEMITFIKNSDYTTKKYALYSVLDDKILVLDGSNITEITLKDSLNIYDGNNKTTFSAIKSKLAMGDEITLRYDDYGAIDYVIYNEGTLIGPKTVENSSWYSMLGVDIGSATIVRDGIKCSYSDIKTNDIVYYNQGVNMVLSYSKNVTGVYENALPNKDNPSSVTISGISYEIEGAAAYNKLSSNGDLKYGDTITALLGKDGKIADVITLSSSTSSTVGYLIKTGTKVYKDNDNNDYSAFYATVVTTSGVESEYKTDKNYKSYINLCVNVTFSNGEAKITKTSSNQSLGKVDNSKMTIGSLKVAQNVEILDVSSTYSDEPTLYKSVYLQRIDGLELTNDNTLYVEKNSMGEIIKIILKDLTGDMYTYAVTSNIKITKDGDGAVKGYAYTFDSNGQIYTDSGRYLSVSLFEGAKLILDQNNIHSVKSMTCVDSKITQMENSYIIAGNTKYTLSSDIIAYTAVYDNSINDYKYFITPLDTIKNNMSDYKSISAYYDKAESKGGRVRIIIAKK